MKILVTGVMGFIGSHFARIMLAHNEHVKIVGFARNASLNNRARIKDILNYDRFSLVCGDMTDMDAVSELMDGVDVVVNFAAKTFVDHSIKDPQAFINSNIIGTYNLLEQTRKYRIQRYIQVSTDEVYGAILKGSYKEDSRLNPTNPYAASKAAGDMLCLSYYHTYGTPIIITRTENNFGPYQHPQKAIPTFVRKAMLNEDLPIYGDGQQIRDWLFVKDHCSAIRAVLAKGRLGETYNLGGWNEKANLDVVNTLCEILDVLKPRSDGASYKMQINFVKDRPGHDRRYAIDATKIERELGWKPQETFETGIRKTVSWYLQNQTWVDHVVSGDYRHWVNQQYS
jgi:dTDP-glucose 4,6-dehydratase